MNTRVFDSRQEMAEAAAENAATIIRDAITQRGAAYLIAATGASQFEFLEHLIAKPGIDWKKCTFFHLDEYVGLPETHRASFRRYLRERIVQRVHPEVFHLINGDAANPQGECQRVGELISRCVIDAAFVGIGENGHLAFNDPPADFNNKAPYLVVDLDVVVVQGRIQATDRLGDDTQRE